MPGPLAPEVLAHYANPAYLSREAPAAPMEGSANWMRRVGIPAMAGGEAFDAGTTIAALRDPQLREGNAFFGANPSAARVIGTKAALMVPLGLLLDRVYANAPEGSGKRKAALAGALALGAFTSALGVHNMQQMRR